MIVENVDRTMNLQGKFLKRCMVNTLALTHYILCTPQITYIGIEVSMKDTFTVKIFHSFSNVLRNFNPFTPRKWQIFVFKDFLKGSPIDELQKKEILATLF